MISPESAPDGSLPFVGESAHVQLYDLLYGREAEKFGDIAFYEQLAAAGRPRILDAACGTGRISTALAGPGRTVHGFDASPQLLTKARENAAGLPADAQVSFSEARLESFALDRQFDLVIVGYYGFSYLLDETSRRDCLNRIRAHLAPKGMAILHLPAPALLNREVPRSEIDTMKSRMRATTGPGSAEHEISFAVTAMDFDPETGIRSVKTHIEVRNPNGDLGFEEASTMRYACIDEDHLITLADQADLAVTETRSGFHPDATSELVALLQAA